MLPKQADEFTCLRCHLAAHRSQRSKPGVSVCRDCADRPDLPADREDRVRLSAASRQATRSYRVQ